MPFSFFFKGILLGFAIALPVGPIALLCIRRTLQFGRLSGLFSGLGAAAADALFASVAAFGLTFVSDLLLAGHPWLRLIGGGFLIYLGLRICFATVNERHQEVSHITLIHDLFSTFFLTLTNPMTILSFLAIFTGFGLSGENYVEASLLVAGVFSGSAAWWLLLTEGISFFRPRVSHRSMRWINRIAGSIILAFGIVTILSGFLSN